MTPPHTKPKSYRGSLLAAIFLMATSAIGPGFITQTATFTAQLGTAFAFAILVSIVIDIAVQLNIWRMVIASGRKAGPLSNAAIPGSGYVLAVLILIGGLVFNVGNIAGAGQGLNIMFGLDNFYGGLLSALLAIGIFSSKRAGLAVDRLIIFLGILMIVLTLYVAFMSNPPVADAARSTFWPDVFSQGDDAAISNLWTSVTTIVGGTVGGYITYAGAHRLLDRGISGPHQVATSTRGAINGIIVTGIMRFVLFLAILGVVVTGTTILGTNENPAAIAFRTAAGDIGYRLFGLVLWCAAITSVIGAAYTSVTFMETFLPKITEQSLNYLTIFFISISLIVLIAIGQPPQAVLVFAGGFNGLILPIGFSILMLVGWTRPDLMNGYKYPKWLLIIGTLVCFLTWYMGYKSFGGVFKMIGIEV